MQESIALRTLRISQIGTILMAQGGFPLLKIFGGSPQIPLNCSAADPNLLLSTITLPATPLGSANGVTTMIPPWTGTVAQAGYAQCYRLYDSTPTCHLQGYCSELWQPSTTYSIGQNVANANGVYDCTAGGVSASGGIGPSGIGSGIVDGSVTWAFLWPTPEMVFSSTNLAPGLVLPVQSFSVTAANA